MTIDDAELNELERLYPEGDVFSLALYPQQTLSDLHKLIAAVRHEREPNRVLRESLVLARKKLFSVSEGAIPTGIDRALKQIDRALAWSYSND